MKKIIPNFKIPKLSGILNPAAEMGESLVSGVSGAFNKVTGTFDTGTGLLKSTLGGIPFLGSTFSSKTYDHTQYDERHYFLIPDPASSLVNPVLYHLVHKISLDMWMMESEKFEFQSLSIDFSQADILRLTELSKKAISDTLVGSEIDDHLNQVIEIIEGSH